MIHKLRQKQRLLLLCFFYSSSLFVTDSVFSLEFLRQITIQASAYQTSSREIKIVLQGNLKKTWHIYAIQNTSNFPLATKIKFLNNNWQQINLIESQPSKIYDELAGSILAVHKNIFEFTQTAIWKGKTPVPTSTSMALVFQICNQKICSLEQTINFHILIK